MLNLSQVSGVKGSPISKSILENAIGVSHLSDSKAYSNFEFMSNMVRDGAFGAPISTIAMGSGKSPLLVTGQTNFFSSSILARTGYKNSWHSFYNVNEALSVEYFTGSSLFKRFSIVAETGKVNVRAINTRNGNTRGKAGLVQHILGYNGLPNASEVSQYSHNIRTRHDASVAGENAIDFFTWSPVDAIGDMGSRRVLSLYGNGSVEIVNGGLVNSGVDVTINTSNEDAMAVSGKGVIYFNKNSGKYRYSENGGKFKNFGSGSGGVSIETVPYAQTSKYRMLKYGEMLGVKQYIDSPVSIKGCYLALSQSNDDNSFYEVSLYVSDVITSDNKVFSYSKKASKTIETIHSNTDNMVLYEFDSVVAIDSGKWIAITIRQYNTGFSQNPTPTIMNVGVNMASSIGNSDIHVQPQFMYTGVKTLPSSLNLSQYGLEHDKTVNPDIVRVETNLIPYVRLKLEG